MECDAFMFTAGKGAVLGAFASADAPNHWVGVASLGAGQCPEFAGKPHLSTESSEEPWFIFIVLLGQLLTSLMFRYERSPCRRPERAIPYQGHIARPSCPTKS